MVLIITINRLTSCIECSRRREHSHETNLIASYVWNMNNKWRKNKCMFRKWTACTHFTLPLARAGRGVMHPPWVFLEWPPNRWADRAQILHSLWGILCAAFGIKNWPVQVRSRSYDVMRGTTSDRLFKEIVFSSTGLAAINWNGDVCMI